MSTPPRTSPRFRKEEQEAPYNNTGDGGAIRKDFQCLNINAEGYQPPMARETQVMIIWPLR